MRRAKALLGLLILLVGLPVLLVWRAGWPLPHRWPSGTQWSAWLSHPVTTHTITAGVACLIWLLWVVLAIVVALEALRTIARVRLPRLRLPAPLQALTAGLVGSSMATLTPHTAIAAVAPTTAPTPSAAGVAPAVVRVAPALPDGTGMLLIGDCGYLYTVHRGDSLWHIAQQCLGAGDKWPQIWQLNKGRFWPAVSGYRHLDDPNLILPHWTLQLPDTAQPPHHSTPHHPARHPHAGNGSAPTPPTPTATPAATRASRVPGVDLPGGGWVSLGLAAAVTAAATLIWRRRRHTYTPTPTPASPQSLALPATVTQIRHALRHATTEATLAEHPAGTLEPGAAQAGAEWPTTGLGLAGPAGEAAVRGLLVEWLADPTRGPAVIPRATLHRLLDTATVPILSRLVVATDLDEALRVVEEIALRRARIRDDHDTPPDPTHEPVAPLLLIIDTDLAEQPAHPAMALGHTHPAGIHGVVAGPWPDGTTLTVAGDGTTSPALRLPYLASGRMTVITATHAVELLAVLAEAQTPPQPATPHPDAAPARPSPPATVPPFDPAAAPAGVAREAPPAGPVSAAVADAAPVGTPAMSSRVRVRLLGPAEICDLPPIGPHRPPLRAGALELLVYLAVHRRGVHRDQLLEDLFGYVPRSKVNARMNTHVYNLRTVLSSVAGKHDYLTRTHDTYRLNPNLFDIDLWHLTDALTDLADIDTLGHGLDIYQGELVEGSGYEWVEPHREALRRTIIDASATLADQLADTAPARARRVLERAITHDPYNEALYQHAMRLAPNHASATRLLARLTERLADIDATPGPDTVRLATHRPTA